MFAVKAMEFLRSFLLLLFKKDSGIGGIGLGGKSSWDVDEEMAELKQEKTTTLDDRVPKPHAPTGTGVLDARI